MLFPFMNCVIIDMADYPPSEIVDIIGIFYAANNNAREAARQYQDRYPDRRHPDHKAILRLTTRARTGLLKRKRSKKPLNNDDAIIVTILGMVIINPHIGQRQISRELNVSRTTVGRILRANHFHPYHITLNQELSDNDKILRVNFCRWAIDKIQLDSTFFSRVMFSDEAAFESNGMLNRHNSHYYSNINPHWVRHVDNQHRWKVIVWCGILDGHIIGPHFFDDNVTGDSYLRMLRDVLPRMLEFVDENTVQHMWLQQDGAPPHYARPVKNFLNLTYQRRWIGRGGHIAWPPRSPDLTSPDFFLWGYLKNIVYQTAPTTAEELKGRIRQACRNISANVLRKTVNAFERRLQLCIQQNGGTFEHLL